ncbi:MAG: AhpC/TSA family protein [Muribaculaceae bacterium]|nr:AhpC/TSA family protein [Muribaculaceae bacterium]
MKRFLCFATIGLVALATRATEQSNDSITCHITGTVIDRPESKSVIISEANTDSRIHKYATAEIIDGTFSYTIKDSVPRAYQIRFDDELENGSWLNRYFYSGNGDVEITCYNNDDEFDSKKIISNISENILENEYTERIKALFQAKQNYLSQKFDSLYECNAALSPELQNLHETIEKMEPSAERDSITGVLREFYRGPREIIYSEEYMDYENQLIDIYRQRDAMRRQFIADNPSLAGLFEIKNTLFYSKYYTWADIPDYIRIFETFYKNSMPDHPYTEEIAGIIESMSVKAGNQYPDYKITREDGSTERIASLIDGNVAVVDLWASWCGPCRRHSKELIPIYEKYKDKGFKVIAIAREEDNCDAMNHCIKNDGYPWESFVDLGDRDNVWRINNAGNSGGKIILVGADGVIVGTDISAKEIEEYLAKTLGE